MPFKYAPPGGQNDMIGRPNERDYLDRWSSQIETSFRKEISALKQELGQAPLFFTEVDQPLPAGNQAVPVPWGGFPRPLVVGSGGDRMKALEAAEVRGKRVIGFSSPNLNNPVSMPYRRQDEYLEWVSLKKNGQVVGFAFTAEGPEYWEHLADMDKEAVRKLYETFAGRSVTWAELEWKTDIWVAGRQGPVRIYRKSDYNPYNAVNMEEVAAHLTHPANTLGAEINLAARATIQRSDALGSVVSERRRLACCSDFGDPNRNSDPGIGNLVNVTVRGGVSVTLADPVGLYINAFDDNRVADSEGNPLPGWWTLKRGPAGRGLRAEFRAPEGSNLTLADVRVGNNETLKKGGQLAELTSMVLYAKAAPLGVAEPAARQCVRHCCVKKGAPRDQSLLEQVGLGEMCPGEMVDAFPELTQVPVNPFTRRAIAAAGFGRKPVHE